MWTRRVIGIALGIALVALSFVPMFGQGSLSDQVLRLLDRENTWTKKQTIAASYGIQLNDGAPTNVANKVYNVGGSLYWNGAVVGSGGGTSYWTLTGGTTLGPDSTAYNVRLGSAGLATVKLHVDGTMLVAGATTLSAGAIFGNNTGTAAGTIRWTGANFEGYSGVGWVALDATAGTAGGWTDGVATNTVYLATGTRKVSIGAGTTATAFLHILGTTEQIRVANTAAEYMKLTVSNTAIATFDAVSAGATAAFTFSDPVTFSGNIEVVSTTAAQIRATYDGTNYATMSVGATGIVSLDATSATAADAFTIADPTTINNNLVVQKTTGNQFSVIQQTGQRMDLAVSSTGIATFDATGTGAAFIFSDGVTVHSNIEVVKATEQFRATYDGSNRMTLTVGSTGVATFDTVGTAPGFSFSDPITADLVGNVTGNVTGNASGTAATVTGATQAAITTVANVVTVGALGSGSIAAGFGAIDVGADAISGGAITGTTGTFSGVVTLGGTAVGEIRFLEPSGTGTDYIAFKAPATVASNVVFVLPNADGTAGQALTTDGSKNLGWSTTAATGMANPMTTKGDIIYASNTAATSTPARLGLGTVGQCLVSDAGTTDFPKWGSCAAAATAAGADTQVQYNNAGAFGANGAFTWVAPTLSLSGATTGARVGLQIRNTGSGSSDTVALQLGNNTGADTLSLKLNSSTYNDGTPKYHTATLNNKLGALVLAATDTTAMTLISTGVTIPGTLGVTGAISSAASVALTGTTNNLGTITTGVWNAGAVTSSGAITGTIGDFSGAVDSAGNFSVATSKFTVASATGDTVVAGTLGVTGAITGNLTGNAATVTVAALTTGATNPVLFTSTGTGSLGPKTDATNFYYDATFAGGDSVRRGALTVEGLIMTRRIIVGDVDDPGDVRIYQAVLDGTSNYSQPGYFGFSSYVGSSIRPYFAMTTAIQGGVTDSFGNQPGMLVFGTASGDATARTPRAFGTGEDAWFPSNSWVASSYGGEDIVPHIALHPSGQFEIGFLTPPATLPSELLLVRGPLSVRMPNIVPDGTYAGSFWNADTSTTAHGLYVRVDQNTATNTLLNLSTGASTTVFSVNGLGQATVGAGSASAPSMAFYGNAGAKDTGFYNYYDGAREVLGITTNGVLRFTFAGNNITSYVDNIPSADNYVDLGSGSRRWRLIRGVTITSGDLRFENDFVLTESYTIGTGLPAGIGMVDHRDATNPKLLAFFGEDGTLYVDNVKTLSQLKGTVKIAVRKKEN